MKYNLRLGKEVDAVQWTGSNLREIIDLIGLHPSAEKWTWEEYEEVVKKEGLKIFTYLGPVMPPINSYIIMMEGGSVYHSSPEKFVENYAPVIVKRKPVNGKLRLTKEELVEFERMFIRKGVPLESVRLGGQDRIIVLFVEKYDGIYLDNYKALQYLLERFLL